MSPPGCLPRGRDALIRLEQRLVRSAVKARSPRVDRSLVTLGTAANNSRLWMALAAVLAVFGGARGRRASRAGISSVAIASALANGPAKLLVRRSRPGADAEPALINMPRSSSFPSGHAASAFAFATAVGTEMPWLAPVLGPLAAAVAYSRVHTGVHYPGDVAAGAAIGVGSATVVRRYRRARS